MYASPLSASACRAHTGALLARHIQKRSGAPRSVVYTQCAAAAAPDDDMYVSMSVAMKRGKNSQFLPTRAAGVSPVPVAMRQAWSPVSLGTDVAGASPVPVPMWQGRAQSRRSCGRGEPRFCDINRPAGTCHPRVTHSCCETAAVQVVGGRWVRVCVCVCVCVCGVPNEDEQAEIQRSVPCSHHCG